MADRFDLVEIRRMRGYSQEYMAETIGVHRNTYAAIEKQPDECSIKVAKKICEVLNVDAESINFFNTLSTKRR